MTHGRAMSALATGAVLMLSAGLAGCATAPHPGPPGALAPAQGAQQLAGICPDPIVVQTHWDPGTDSGAAYQLLGPDHVIDSTRKTVSGRLVAGGKDTGVKVEIRSGGAAIGFTPVPAQLYLDRSITLGQIRTDTAISTSARFPVTAVMSWMNKSPQALMWDPASHPDWHGIADIGASTARVLVTKDSAFAPFLVAKGLLKQSQIDLGYTGNPARFVAEPTIAQQAYGTDEPYIYQHEVKAWGKPIAYQLLADVGYTIYPDALSVRTEDIGPLSACLHRLIPIVQQAGLDYVRNPGPTNRLIVDAVAQFNTGWTYSIGVADYAIASAKRLHLIAEDTTGPFGGMDPRRVQETINTFAPILAATGANVKPGLIANDIATNQFLDPHIRLPAQ